MALPKSITGVFQGLLLFTLLACDTLIHYRLLWQRRAAAPASTPAAGAASAPKKA
jgi:simple sugar transport system permease protein